MTHERDFIEELNDYTEKIRQEHAAIRDEQALVGMIRYRARLRALHEEAYETEMMRGAVSQALRPYLPAPAESQPVALQGGPVPYAEDPYENPRFMQSDLPPHEVGRYGE